ncbi:hypothetical protein DM828_03990 [Pseudomonas umsongensis]|jgi:hypothetical protein|nr:hypothetical protein [Pseudomonas umsongensis]
MLAMEVNDNAGSLTPLGGLRFFASMLAPTGVAPMGHRGLTERLRSKAKRGDLTADLTLADPTQSPVVASRLATTTLPSDS